MPWIPLAVAAVSAVQGEAQRAAQQRQNQKQADISAAQTQYSPWTHLGASTPQMQAPTPSALGGAAQGALAGAMYSQQSKNNDLWQQMMQKQMAGGGGMGGIPTSGPGMYAKPSMD